MSSKGGGTNTIEKANPTEEEKALQRESLKQQQFATQQYSNVSNYFSNPANIPQYFPTQTFADLNQTQLGALALQGNVAGQQASFLPGLTSQALDYGLNQSINPASNPFFQQNIAAAIQPVTDQFINQALPQLGSAAQEAGAYGGSRHGQVESFLANDYVRSIGDIATKLGAQQYQSGQDTFARTLGLLPQTLQSNYLPGQTLGSIGDLLQNQTQLGLNEDVARWNFAQTAEAGQLAQAGALLPGGQVITGLGGSTTTTSGGGGNRGLGILSGASTGAGIGSALGTAGALGLTAATGGLWGAGIGALLPLLF